MHGKIAVCPRCGKQAVDTIASPDNISKVFGWRYKEGQPRTEDNKIPQSHCNECRSEEASHGHA